MEAWPGKWVRILRPERGATINAALLGRFLEIPLHWSDGDMPCWGAHCRICPARVKRKYYAPASFLKFDSARGLHLVKPGVVELYEEHMERFEGEAIRGLEIKVCKSAKGKLAIIELRRLPEQLLQGLYREFDPVPALERWFGMPLVCPGKEGQVEKPDTVSFEEFKKRMA